MDPGGDPAPGSEDCGKAGSARRSPTPSGRGGTPTVGTLALGQVDVRIAAKTEHAAEAGGRIAPVEAEMRSRLIDALFTILGRDCRARGRAVRHAIAWRFRGVILPGPDSLEHLGCPIPAATAPADLVTASAEVAARWAGARVGSARRLESVPDSIPLATLVSGVSVNGRAESREYRDGDTATSVRTRAATVLLDLRRRSLPTQEVG